MPVGMGKFMRFALVVAACGLAVAGCAKHADRVGATYESPNPYQSYTCPELAAEASDLSARAARATGEDFTGNRAAIEVGRVVFFPLLVFNKDYFKDPAEVARINSSMEAIEQASIQKNCGITFRRLPTSPLQTWPNERGAIH